MKCVTMDKWYHVLQPNAKKDWRFFLDGCVLATGFTQVDLDKLPSSENKA